MRDYNREHQDTCERKYEYDFDRLLRGYMRRSFAPFHRPGKALELGCYKGEFTSLLAESFADLTVVEGASDLVDIARERVRPGVKFIHATFETVDLAAEYDSIFLIHTLEHLDDPRAVLGRIGTWLAPGGRLFVAVPNANAASRQIAVKMGLIEHNSAVSPAERVHGHRRTYALDTLETEVGDAGLSVLSRGGVFFKPFANFQFDRMAGTDVISAEYLEGCYRLGMHYPDLCATVYAICETGNEK